MPKPKFYVMKAAAPDNDPGGCFGTTKNNGTEDPIAALNILGQPGAGGFYTLDMTSCFFVASITKGDTLAELQTADFILSATSKSVVAAYCTSQSLPTSKLLPGNAIIVLYDATGSGKIKFNKSFRTVLTQPQISNHDLNNIVQTYI